MQRARRRVPLPPRAEELLGLMLDEVWDLTEAIDGLEERRARLRDAILKATRASGVERHRHARGALRIDRYQSYRVARPTRILPYLKLWGWEDQALQVKGRALRQLAAERPEVARFLDDILPVVRHEVLVLSPDRKRARARRVDDEASP